MLGRRKLLKKIIPAAVIAALFVGLVVMIVSITMQIEAAVAAGAMHLFSQQEEEDLDAQLLEHFTITGTKDGNNYHLTFQFDDWKIDDIDFSMRNGKGSVSKSVQVPSVSGTHQQMAYQYLRQHGFTPEGAFGLMANINAESEFIENREEGDAAYRGETVMYRGWGICQWTNTGRDSHGRRYKAIQYVKNKGFNPARKSEQMFLAELQYAITEKGYAGIIKRMKKCTDVTAATRIWCTEWEIPENRFAQAAIRAEVAKKYLRQFQGSGFRSTGSTRSARLSLAFTASGDTATFTGTLDGTEIAGSFIVKQGRCSGSGEYGEGASAFAYGAGNLANPFGKNKFHITSIALVMRWGRMHDGWDLDGGSEGTPIYAVSSGKVAYAGGMGGYGSHVVVIQSGNLWVLYGHMCGMSVHAGQSIRQGQRIGSMGNEGHSFGAHLHLEFRKNGLYGPSTANVKAVSPMFQRWAYNYNSVKSEFSRCIR